MKSALKKLVSLNRSTLVRNILFSVLFLAFYMIVLYILINSPA
jgi:hypothetical protein